MRRLRIVLVLVALGLAVPVMLLVTRARNGERLERELRHQAVAARAFDEMERSLTTLLEREESRPFEAYRALVGETPGPPQDLPAFVVGYFRVDPDGSFHARPGRNLAQVVQQALARDFEGGRRAAPPAIPLLRDARGSDAALESAASPATPDRDVPDTRASPAPALADSPSTSDRDAFDVLSRLNLARSQRAERKQQVVQELASKLYGDDAGADDFFEKDVRADTVPRPSPAQEAESRPALAAEVPAPTTPGAGTVRQRALDHVDEAEEEPTRAPGAVAESETRLRVALDPMVGRPVGENLLVLSRTVLVGERGYRQGVVLDRAALAAWLEDQVLDGQGLAGVARLRLAAPDSDASWAPEGHLVFTHRFAEPFDAMSAQLALAPLPGRNASSALPIYALAGLLALVAAAGLLAVDRMARVVVSFAERRGRFVASVSHELKTPLTAIRMYAEMLRDGLVGDEAKRDEYYGTITDESERLSRLIDNVLEFSRLEKGQREIELVVGGVADVLEEATDKLRPHAERRGFRLRVACEAGLPAVRYDRDAMLQVLFNLVDNAMKYARPCATPEVVLEARRDGAGVVVGVRDFGPGVDARLLTRIFEPFYRAEEELTRTTTGSGIGLALVKELGQAMGAAVSGANAEGGGFRVSLAFAPAA